MISHAAYVHIPKVLAATATVLSALAPVPLRAHGYHGPVMSTTSPQAWEASAFQQLQNSIPNLSQKLKAARAAPAKAQASKLRTARSLDDLKNQAGEGDDEAQAAPAAAQPGAPAAGGRLQAEFSPQERALLSRAAAQCLDVLAHLDRRNIYPSEFPNFPVGAIDGYRARAKRILAATGPVGADAVVQRLRSDLMAGNPGFGGRMSLHPQFHRDLLASLRNAATAGYLTPEHNEALRQAASGAKPAPQAALAQAVEALLDEHWIATAELRELIDALQGIEEGSDRAGQDQRLQQRLLAEIGRRVAKASLEDLVLLLERPEALDARLRQRVERAVVSRLGEADVAALLAVADRGPAAAKTAALDELARRRPTYAEVKDRLPQIWSACRSSDPAVAAAAQRQAANAFQRAPISHCLVWLGYVKGEEQQDLIWRQVDARIARADADRRSEYRQAALAIAAHQEAGDGARLAALELLTRLNDRQAAGPLVELLEGALTSSDFPRTCWPAAGETLRKLTGQDYGPRPGDGGAELAVAVKQWRAWLAESGK